MIFHLHFPRFKTLRDINAYHPNTNHGYFNILERASQISYLETFTTFIIILFRLASYVALESIKIPDDLRTLVLEVTTKENLHLVLLKLLQVHTENVARGNHPVGWILALILFRGERYPAMNKVTHTLVHFIHLARLVTYWELRKRKDEIPAREQILSIVKISYTIFLHSHTNKNQKPKTKNQKTKKPKPRPS